MLSHASTRLVLPRHALSCLDTPPCAGCSYAHGDGDLRRPEKGQPHNIGDLYKTTICGSWLTTGTCPKGFKCRFAHDPRLAAPGAVGVDRSIRSAVASTELPLSLLRCIRPSPRVSHAEPPRRQPVFAAMKIVVPQSVDVELQLLRKQLLFLRCQSAAQTATTG